MDPQVDRYTVWKHRVGAQVRAVEDAVAVEEPLEIRVAGRSVSVTMRTPGHDRELVVGFLAGEGIVSAPGQIVHVRSCDRADGALADVTLAPDAVFDFARLTRHVFASSSCGVCGAATIEAVRRACPALGEGPMVDVEMLLALPERLRAAQSGFSATGGMHAAGVFDASGALLVAREDVGRHNAVDKALGHMFLEGAWPLRSHVLMVSGRASFEIVQKALAAGVTIVAAVSAPSSLAVDLARESNLTLVGFVRAGGLNVYAGQARIGALGQR